MRFFLFIFILLLSSKVLTQKCTYLLEGVILNEETNGPLENASIYIKETNQGVLTDSLGKFSIPKLCKGIYHLKIRHLGCAEKEQIVSIESNKRITAYLHHHTELLDEVVVNDRAHENNTSIIKTIDKNEIAKQNGQSLGVILENVSGVSSIKNGNGIAKPVIHGLYGNRIGIVNNGIKMINQNWGNDHAPEIDPSIADYISVVKGVNSLEYGGGSLGGIVLIEPSEIGLDPHVHGNINTSYQSNGNGLAVSGRIQKKSKFLGWRIHGSTKIVGDSKSPNYYLTNTGVKENNIGLQLEKKVGKLKNQLYYSVFQSEIGILKGSQLSNTTDLNLAIDREVPYFTSEKFSYEINYPSQKVSHQLFKFQSIYNRNTKNTYEFKHGTQINDRDEFDNRRNNLSSTPTLSLSQISHLTELSYTHHKNHNQFFKIGIQFQNIDNTNSPLTGILPLIPDYRSYTSSLYSKFSKEAKSILYEVGVRTDYINSEALTISNTLPRTIIRDKRNFTNFSLSSGIRKSVNQNLHFSFNTGFSSRAPAINELYSNGLHQGVASIERGDWALNQENSFKIIASMDANIKSNIWIDFALYSHFIQNYIYLELQDNFELTIRGAFPLYIYNQTNARINGSDLSISAQLTKKLMLKSSYSFLEGTDVSNETPLIFMPSNSLKNTLSFSPSNKNLLKNQKIELWGNYTFKQKNINLNQEILDAPDGYLLFNLNYSTQIPVKKNILAIHLESLNIFNTSYRDYLNRLRYFANEIGVTHRLTIRYIF